MDPRNIECVHNDDNHETRVTICLFYFILNNYIYILYETYLREISSKLVCTVEIIARSKTRFSLDSHRCRFYRYLHLIYIYIYVPKTYSNKWISDYHFYEGIIYTTVYIQYIYIYNKYTTHLMSSL